MVHILGQNHKVVEFGSCKYWAERGLIHCEDSRDNSYHTIPRRHMLERLRALHEMQWKADGTEGSKERAFLREERSKVQTFIEGMLAVVALAREQGEPFNPDAIRAAQRAMPTQVLLDKLPTKLTKHGIVRNRKR